MRMGDSVFLTVLELLGITVMLKQRGYTLIAFARSCERALLSVKPTRTHICLTLQPISVGFFKNFGPSQGST